MPLYRHTKLPPPPEPGEKSFWQYLPRQSGRRVFFLLLALGAVLVLRATGGFSKFGSLFDAIGAGPAQRRADGADAGAAPVYHIKVTRPEGTPPPSGRP